MDPNVVWMIRLVVIVVLAVGGYQQAGKYEREHGYTPWHLPSWVWGLFFALGLIPGLVLWAIAGRTTKAPYVPPVAPAPGYAPSPAPSGPAVGGSTILPGG